MWILKHSKSSKEIRAKKWNRKQWQVRKKKGKTEKETTSKWKEKQ
jgi:hypothetical protein